MILTPLLNRVYTKEQWREHDPLIIKEKGNLSKEERNNIKEAISVLKKRLGGK